MIVDSTDKLIYSLLATTFLGAIMGYLVARLRAQRQARMAIDAARAEMNGSRSAAEVDLKSARAVLDDLKKSLAQTKERAETALQREEALEVHSQLQAQRIQTLESQVSLYEDQQIRLQRDFASYKSNKSRELEMARSKPDSWAGANELPVLQKRIVESSAPRANRSSVYLLDPSRKPAENPTTPTSGRQAVGLSKPLSRELDIPSLAESELPDSVDDLEFDLVDLDETGESPSG